MNDLTESVAAGCQLYICISNVIMGLHRIGGNYNYDSTSLRVRFDCNLTVIRLRYDHSMTYRAGAP